ncbi:MAG: P-loop NTPase [Verrucomicrobiota bacterium]
MRKHALVLILAGSAVVLSGCVNPDGTPNNTGSVALIGGALGALTGAVIISTPSDVSLQDARKALEMFHQVNVEVLGLVENMSQFTCPHCNQVIDIFSRGGAERLAKQANLAFLGSIELDSEIRHGGDHGLPIVLAGEGNAHARQFFEVARKVAERALAVSAKDENIFEIT